MAICSFVEVLTALNLLDTRTLQQEALARLCHFPAEQAVREVLGYNPEQATYSEFLTTRADIGGDSEVHGYGDDGGVVSHFAHHRVAWDYGGSSPYADVLILKNIPVRSIVEIREQHEGQAGQGVDTFPASSVLLANDDFWLDLDEAGLCRSGMVFRNGGWLSSNRSIKLSYVGGWSANEFMGPASPIKMAVLQTLMVMFKQLTLQGAAAGGGFLAGNLIREKLGDYEYALSNKSGSDLSSFTGEIGTPPASAMSLLEPFIHYGRKVIS